MPKSARTLLLERGRRLSNSLRPAVLNYSNARIPCTPGNLEFFEQLRADGGGFSSFQNLHVTILRADIPPSLVFHKGHKVQLHETESGDKFDLYIGDNNSRQAAIITLNLKTNPG